MEKNRRTANDKLWQFVPLKGQSTTQGRHVDAAHLGEKSHEKTLLSEAGAKLWSSTKDRFREIAGGLQISIFRSNSTELRGIFLFRLLGEERFMLSPGGPRAGEATGTCSIRSSSTTFESHNLVLMLLHSEGCHPDTFAHYYSWPCNGASQSDPNKYADHSRLGLRVLSLQGSEEHALTTTWCYQR